MTGQTCPYCKIGITFIKNSFIACDIEVCSRCNQVVNRSDSTINNGEY